MIVLRIRVIAASEEQRIPPNLCMIMVIMLLAPLSACTALLAETYALPLPDGQKALTVTPDAPEITNLL